MRCPSSSHLLLALAIVACGDADFSGSSGKSPDVPTEKPQEEPVRETADATPDVPLPRPAEEAFPLDQAQVAGPVDIAFLVDTSGSMGEEKAALERSMADFLNRFFVQNLSDFQMYLIGEGFQFPPLVAANPKVQVIPWRIGSHDALQAAAELLNGTIPGLTMPLREGVTTELVVVTDDDAEGGAIAIIQAAVLDPSRGVRVHGIVGLRKGFNGFGCSIANRGNAYIALAEASQPPGLIQDLCNQDWQALLTSLGESILETKPVKIVLSAAPDLDRDITFVTDAGPVDMGFVTYDEAEHSFTVERAGLPEGATVVNVTYYPLEE